MQRLLYAVVFATAGTEDSKEIPRPLVLDDIASSKRRTEHRIGLRPLRRDAASLDTPKRMTLAPFSEGAMPRRRTGGLCSSPKRSRIRAPLQVSTKRCRFPTVVTLFQPDRSFPMQVSVRSLMQNVFEENQLPYGNTCPERVNNTLS